MGAFLETIVAATSEELARRQAETPLERLAEMIGRSAPPRDFVGAIGSSDACVTPTGVARRPCVSEKRHGIRLIAEVKRASPSRGWLNESADAASLAREYERGGASAISVLTEPRFFKGKLQDLAAAASAVRIPVLRKDFILNAYQVYESRAFGADAVLLIAAILSDEQLARLLDLACSLGMGALVEVHDGVELDRVIGKVEHLRCSPCPVALGVNNRDLKDFTVDLERTFGLRARVPEGVTLVSESGIRSREDVLRLESAGVDAILVGETLVTSPDPQSTIRYLLGW